MKVINNNTTNKIPRFIDVPSIFSDFAMAFWFAVAVFSYPFLSGPRIASLFNDVIASYIVIKLYIIYLKKLIFLHLQCKHRAYHKFVSNLISLYNTVIINIF